MQVARPGVDEIPDFFKGYVASIDEADGVAALERQQAAITAIGRLTPGQASHRYADGKWTVGEVVGHMMDGERIFIYRLLRIARGDRTPLPAFDENEYAKTANAGTRSPADLAAEFATIRASAISLARSLDERSLAQHGVVRAGEISARAQLFVIAGHFQHHLNILRERYQVPL